MGLFNLKDNWDEGNLDLVFVTLINVWYSGTIGGNLWAFGWSPVWPRMACNTCDELVCNSPRVSADAVSFSDSSALAKACATVLASTNGYAVSSLVAKPLFVTPHFSWRWDDETPGHFMLMAANAGWLWANIFRFNLLLPYWQVWNVEYITRWATSCQNVVAQNRLYCGFSTQTRRPFATQCFTNCAVKWYNLLAFEILNLFNQLSPDTPLGWLLLRKGLGSFWYFRLRFPVNLIDLALLAVPQGGAKKIPSTVRVLIQLIKRATPSGLVKSATDTGPDKFFTFTWSTPKQLRRPICLKQAVTLEVPAKISIITALAMSSPDICAILGKVWLSSQDPFAWRSCSDSAWGAWQFLLQQRCQRCLHSPPAGAASQRPRLYPKQRRLLWGSVDTLSRFCNALGNKFDRSFPLNPFPFPLPPLCPL